MYQPCGDTIIVEKFKQDSSIIVPDTGHHDEDTYIVKMVGKGYVTEQGQIIPPEVIEGDKVIIKGSVLELQTLAGVILLARAQDVLVYERGDR